MTLLRLALALVLALASACAGTCSAMSPTGLGGGAMLGGMGRDMLAAPSSGDAPAPAPTPPGDPSLWYSAANIDGQGNATLSDGDPVCTWVDLGSLGVNATQGTASACPTFDADGGPGGGPALVFDGGDWLSTASLASMAQPNLIAVVSRSATGTATELLVDTPSGTRNRVGKGSTGPNLNAGAVLAHGVAMGNATWHSVVAVANDASSAIRLDGAATTGAAGSQAMAGTMGVGAGPTGVNFLTGRLLDVLVYDTPPSADDVEAYQEAACDCTFPVAP